MNIKLNRNRGIAGVSLITAILMLFLLMLMVLVGYVLWLWIWANLPNVPPPPGVASLQGTNNVSGVYSGSAGSTSFSNLQTANNVPIRLSDVPSSLIPANQSFDPVQLLPALSNVTLVFSTNLVDWYPMPATNMDSYSIDPHATNAPPCMYFRLKSSLLRTNL